MMYAHNIEKQPIEKWQTLEKHAAGVVLVDCAHRRRIEPQPCGITLNFYWNLSKQPAEVEVPRDFDDYEFTIDKNAVSAGVTVEEKL